MNGYTEKMTPTLALRLSTNERAGLAAKRPRNPSFENASKQRAYHHYPLGYTSTIYYTNFILILTASTNSRL